MAISKKSLAENTTPAKTTPVSAKKGDTAVAPTATKLKTTMRM